MGDKGLSSLFQGERREEERREGQPMLAIQPRIASAPLLVLFVFYNLSPFSYFSSLSQLCLL